MPPPNRQIKICPETHATAEQTEYTHTLTTHTASNSSSISEGCSLTALLSNKEMKETPLSQVAKSWQTKTEEVRCCTLPCGWQYLLNIWALALIIQALLQSNLWGCWETHWQRANKSSQRCYHTPRFSPPSSYISLPPFFLSASPSSQPVCLPDMPKLCISNRSWLSTGHQTPSGKSQGHYRLILVSLGSYSNCFFSLGVLVFWAGL